MEKQKIEVGDIRPVYTITSFQVCKKTSDKPEDIEWIPTEKISEAESLSILLRRDAEYKKPSPTKQKPKKKPKQTEEEVEDDEDDQEDL